MQRQLHLLLGTSLSLIQKRLGVVLREIERALLHPGVGIGSPAARLPAPFWLTAPRLCFSAKP